MCDSVNWGGLAAWLRADLTEMLRYVFMCESIGGAWVHGHVQERGTCNGDVALCVALCVDV
jgi:hypothetical protein